MGDFLENIISLFTDTGRWCVQIINAGLTAYQNLAISGLRTLQLTSDASTFSDFWSVINIVTRVIGVAATTLMALFFVTNIATASWDTRMNLDLWTFVKICLKFCVAVVIVNNAVAIITGIFNFSAKICFIISLLAPGASGVSLTNMELGLSSTAASRLTLGLSGIRGLLVFIVCLIAALAIIVSGVMITMEIYQRIFKLYILIPFSTISFSTFMMGDGNTGNQVFSGYLKSIISVSIESIVIMISIFFSFILINGTTMETLFPQASDEDTTVVTVRNVSELNALYFASVYDWQPFDRADYEDYVTWSDLSSNVLSVIGYDSNKNFTPSYEGDVYIAASVLRGYAYCSVNDETFSAAFQHGASLTYPCTLTAYSELSWGGVFMILLQALFPCLLAASAVKMSGQIANIVMGRG